MKFLSTLLMSVCYICLMGTAVAQAPANDDCAGIINLGVAPACNPQTFYSNLNATASNIGADNIPTCFNGGTVQRDVWFVFTASDTIMDYAITVTGITDGAGATAMLMPQVALYRGSCETDGLAELLCASAPLDGSEVTLEVFGLTAGEVYFLRINDYSASAAPNSGSFQLCIDEYIPAINIGETPGSGSCFGTLYDSGGPDSEYSNDENHTFLLCPQQGFQCLNINMVSYDTEQGFDELTFYAGDNTAAPILAVVQGTGAGNFNIQTASPCVTIVFNSDGSAQGDGFEMTWSCSSLACDGTSPQNPTVIGSVPFSQTGVSTCDDASNFGANPCNAAFLYGPEYVYRYESLGDVCVQISVANADPGTGIAVFYGDPTQPGAVCVRTNEGGFLNSVNMEDAGTYYIVIANPEGCTDFDITITPTDCQLQPSLTNALCNPLNGCASYDANGNAIPSTFFFEQGFEDVPIVTGTNAGCWFGAGFEPDFYWFTIEAQADGPFGFIMQSGGENTDIDINVWGPFTREQVCDSANFVINYITNNQPLRSSWTGGQVHTGLVDIHPDTGIPVTDFFDCGSPATPGAGGDDFVATIPALQGEIYVVLANDFGEGIQEQGMVIDWSPSLPSVLLTPDIMVQNSDTAICAGQSVQLTLDAPFNEITWLNAETLSCNDCPNPVATPSVTTIYRLAIDGVCYIDTVDVKVFVYQLNQLQDATVCLGEQFIYQAGQPLPNATYQWTAPEGFLSCTDCPTPTVTAITPGTYQFSVHLEAPLCSYDQTVSLTVLNTPAPTFTVANDTAICAGSTVTLGGAATPGVSYIWLSQPLGFASVDANPAVTPDSTTLYYVQASNGLCPVPSFDSVFVTVNYAPTLTLNADTTICQGESVLLGNTTLEQYVDYNWTPIAGLSADSIANPLATPDATTTYTLTATRGACVVTDEITVNVNQIALALSTPDTLRICLGTPIQITANESPAGTAVTWTPNDGSLSSNIGDNITANPTNSTLYIATVQIPGCSKSDSLFVQVDSLPTQVLPILPADTTVCQGATVLLRSLPYDPVNFPFMTIVWEPSTGFISPDSLYNVVLSAPSDTTVYRRIVTSGVCIDTTAATVNVAQPTTISIVPANPVVCPGQTVQLTASSPDITDFTWQPAGGLSCTDCPNPIASPSGTTTYTASGMFAGCPVSQSITVNVPPPPVFAFPTNLSLCPGESIVLNTSTNDETTYSWVSADDTNFNPTNIAAPTATPDSTSTYTLTATRGGCTTTANVTVTVSHGALTVSDDITICLGDEVILSAFGNLQGSINWQNGVSGVENTVSPTTSTTYPVTYTFGNNCVITDSIRVTVADDFDLSLTSDPAVTSIFEGARVNLIAAVEPTTTVSYAWSGNGSPISGTTSTITVQPNANPSTYMVTATSADGCVRTATISFEVIPATYDIPNAFSPDNDGNNDKFRLILSGDINVQTFQVFNRWGGKVHDSNNNDGWDGNFNGQAMPSDAYAYVVILNLPSGEKKVLKGDVTLLR